MLLNIYKPKGLTPLQTINLLREKQSEYRDKTIGFAGRLDPLAHGVLLLMIDEETTKEKDTYLNLPKEYQFEAVFGVSTDTYDLLGIVQNHIAIKPDTHISENTIKNFIKSKLGKQMQTYPPYSSKPVHGKPLYQWAREDKLSEIEIPKRDIEIYDLKLLEINEISSDQLKQEVFQQIDSVQGDFRQKEIKKTWEIFFAKHANTELPTAKFSISCSSGTYIRSLVHKLGNKTGLEAIALEIVRTKVGDYDLKDSLKLT